MSIPTCRHNPCTRPAKPAGRFCSPRCRAAWNRENQGVIPARVQSVSRCGNGDTVVSVRVHGEEWHRITDWRPGLDVELLEGE